MRRLDERFKCFSWVKGLNWEAVRVIRLFDRDRYRRFDDGWMLGRYLRWLESRNLKKNDNLNS